MPNDEFDPPTPTGDGFDVNPPPSTRDAFPPPVSTHSPRPDASETFTHR
jgi:hypothetical protein